MVIYLIYKIVRSDFLYWMRIEGPLGIVISLIQRIFCKIIVDFSGCLHFRHPYEVGGLAFSASMLWAQLMPFVALQLYTDSDSVRQGHLQLLLACSTSFWVILNIVFFCMIDLSYLNTFFGFQTGAEFAVKCYKGSTEDYQRYAWVFGSRISYTSPIHAEVKEWVADNIERWTNEKEDWFKLDAIPDEFLPIEIVQAEQISGREEGNGDRKRSSFSVSIGELNVWAKSED